MDYLLITILQLIGIGLHVAQKILALDKLSPDDSFREVFILFWKSDRVTMFVSALVLSFNLVAHYIIEIYAHNITQLQNYALWSFGVAFILGYAGQRLIYNYLGKAEKFLDKKIDNRIQ